MLQEPESVLPKKDRTYHEKRPAPRPETPISSNTDKQLLSQFLAGDYCIQGVSGSVLHGDNVCRLACSGDICRESYLIIVISHGM